MKELRFLSALWKANMLASMEFRVSFLLQTVGMMLNDAVFLVFWIIFFDRFNTVRGWQLADVILVYGLVAVSYGVGLFLFGNALQLGDVIAKGQLDYYLSLPQPVLIHVLASRSHMSALGDVFFGMISFFFTGQVTLDAFGRYLLSCCCSAIIFVSFLVLVNSLAFWTGNVQILSAQATNAIVTFAIYPSTLFDNVSRVILYTLVPAMLVGTLPAELVHAFSWQRLGWITLGAVVFSSLAFFVFYRGLRRYESGSAIQVQL
jgi:ABC-2 type transport system permease protein